MRFDPEGVGVGSDGNFFVSDEYGPYLFKFNRQGHLIKRIPVPEKFLIANPTGEVDDEGNSLELYPDHKTCVFLSAATFIDDDPAIAARA